jgi:hypothetical protein
MLALWLLLDGVPRFFTPLDWLGLKGPLLARQWPGRHGPFLPDLRVTNEHYEGELIDLSNLKPTETYPVLSFATDAVGFRMPYPDEQAAPRVVLMDGDSFNFGAALSEPDTIAHQLGRQLGTAVYPAGRFHGDPDGVKELEWLLRRKGAGRATVVYLYLDRFDVEPAQFSESPGTFDRVGRRLFGQSRYEELEERSHHLRRAVPAWLRLSPLKITLTRAYEDLCDDRILPNPDRERVVQSWLPDGRRMLLRNDEVRRFRQPPDDATVARNADALLELRRHLDQRGIDLWVGLIPDKVNVYAPLLRGEVPLEHGGGPDYLERLEAALEARGVNAVNTLAALTPHAAADVRTGQLAFFREDAHWTPQGVGRCAAAIADAMRADGWRP